MYARFSIDTGVFEFPDIPRGSEEYHAFTHFIRFWKEYGVLVARDMSHIGPRLPPELRKMFESVAKSMTVTAKRMEFTRLAAQDMLDAILSNDRSLDLELFGVSVDQFQRLNPQARRPSYRPHGREEICTISNLLISETAEHLKSHRDDDVSSDTPPEEIWSQKLYPFLRVNNVVHVVDQYALTTFFRSHQEADTGFGFLLRQLAATNGARGDVEILTTTRDLKGDDSPRAFAKLARFCENVNVRGVAFLVATEKAAMDMFHDRFLVGAHHTIDLGNGLESLGREPRRRTVSFSFKQATNTRIRDLHNLRSARVGMREFRY